MFNATPKNEQPRIVRCPPFSPVEDLKDIATNGVDVNVKYIKSDGEQHSLDDTEPRLIGSNII